MLRSFHPHRFLVCLALGLLGVSLCAAPEAVRLGVLQAAPDRARELKLAGISQAVLSVSWDRFEPSAGVPDQAYIRQLRADVKAFHDAGLQLVLDLGIQYPPAWLLVLPDARYKNQYADAFVDHAPGMNVANAVFNDVVREHQAAYIASLFSELGTDWAGVRLGGGWYGELNYPPAKFRDRTNCYWAFDALAQGERPGLPAGITPCPVPGWKPGEPSAGQDSARRFIDWYLASLQNYHDWQISTARRHYAGPLMMLYPSWGIRPGQLEAAIAGGLSGNTAPEKNGEIQRGFDFSRFIGGLRDPHVRVHCTWIDSNPEWSDESSPDEARWSPVHYLSNLARRHVPPLAVSAENTGGGGPPALSLSAKRVRDLNIQIMFWAFAPDLFDGKPPDLKDLAPAFSP
ncbi:MAG: hypothetical protein K0R17_1809 [Rariglobus sp.]|nr:hypothetical protein [Rariglobus sp.]